MNDWMNELPALPDSGRSPLNISTKKDTKDSGSGLLHLVRPTRHVQVKTFRKPIQSKTKALDIPRPSFWCHTS